MGGLFGSAPAPALIPTPVTPSRSDADIRGEALAARQRRAAATGRNETILTSGSGVEEDSNNASVKLLGEG
tara:strand:- start:484 stop:696 length:213 start_codon:yes stop_codon:yes gene_type:complete